MSVYKKFTAQDFATIPFNAHKQYDFGSASAFDNKITYYSTQWTSESISWYSSASTNPYDLLDPINAIKYSQIDNLFYSHFKSNPERKNLGSYIYSNHKRELYEKATIISIPSGLYGHEIKPGSFYISASSKQVVDDNYGHLIISGTNIDNHPTNINRNTFRLDPIDGFRKYDLNVFTGYAGDKEPGYRKHWRKGSQKPNPIQYFNNPDEKWIHDDSYYFNKLSFHNIKYQSSSLGHPSNRFPIINLNSITGSYIASPHNPQYNFNRDDDFSISFWMEPQGTLNLGSDDPTIGIGGELSGGKIFKIDASTQEAYVVYPSIYKSTAQFSDFSLQPDLGSVNNAIGGGEANTTALANHSSETGGTFPLAQEINNLTLGGYSDWWMANISEVREIMKTLGNDNSNPEFRSLIGNNHIDLDVIGDNMDGFGQVLHYNGTMQWPFFATSDYIDDSNFREILAPTKPKLDEGGNCTGNQPYGGCDSDVDGCCTDEDYDTYQGNSTRGYPHKSKVNIGFEENEFLFTSLGTSYRFAFLVRKVSLDSTSELVDDSPNKRYIIAKSGTKTVIPTSMMGQSEITGTEVSGNLQSLNTNSEAQFPYEIYNKGSQLHFDRSDGRTIASVSASVTGSDGSMLKNSHIVCVNSASVMQIWHDGVKVNELDSITILEGRKTQNNANLYIGSKGKLSQNDGLGDNLNKNKFFNGSIGYINIFDHHLESSSIVPMSESINNSPYIGNIFYQNGLATITHPSHYDILANPSYGVDNMIVGENGNFLVSGDGGLNKLKFQGSHLMYEHEYQCTAEEHEFNTPTNISARKDQIATNAELASFTTGSAFSPYITTIGLYNDSGDLLVVGKLGQPIRMSNETDTTFIVRWDT